jgi:hypothetical protein
MPFFVKSRPEEGRTYNDRTGKTSHADLVHPDDVVVSLPEKPAFQCFVGNLHFP